MYTKHPLTQNIIPPTEDAAAWPRPGTAENPTVPFVATPGRPATLTAFNANGEPLPGGLAIAEIHTVNSDGSTGRYCTIYDTDIRFQIFEAPTVIKKLPTPGYSIGLDIHGYADAPATSN